MRGFCPRPRAEQIRMLQKMAEGGNNNLFLRFEGEAVLPRLLLSSRLAFHAIDIAKKRNASPHAPMDDLEPFGADRTTPSPDDDCTHEDLITEEAPAAKKRHVGRPARTLDDLYGTEPPDGGQWSCLVKGEEKVAIFICKYCFPAGRDALGNLDHQISGRVVGSLGTIVSKAQDHCRKQEHISKKLQAEMSKNLSLEEAFRRAEEEKKTAGRLVLSFTRLAAMTGTPLPTMFDSGALDEIVSEFPAGVRSNIRSMTRCSGLLPKADTYMPAVLSVHLTLLRVVIRGRCYSLLIDESRDCFGRPVEHYVSA